MKEMTSGYGLQALLDLGVQTEVQRLEVRI